MKDMYIIFRKEMLDILRDRRTIITTLLVPLFLYPILFNLITKISISQAKKAQAKVLKVAIINHGNASAFKNLIANNKKFKIVENIPEDSVRIYIQQNKLDGAFVFSKNFDERIKNLKAGRVKLYFKSTEDQDITKRRLKSVIDEFEKQLLKDRFSYLNLDTSIVETLKLTEVDVATTQERLGKTIGGFLPYIFVIFCLMGCMYPAIDLGAGEKERGTLETLLTAPVNRFQILLGKFSVVVIAGIATAAISIVGLYIGFRQVKEIPHELFDVILSILEVKSVVLLMSLLLPLTIFFAGMLLSLSFYARSFKEAQSLVSPLFIVVIIPAAIGLIPGITLNFSTALVPILNVSLATKEIIAGTIKLDLLILTYFSLIILAILSLVATTRWSLRESVIFRV